MILDLIPFRSYYRPEILDLIPLRSYSRPEILDLIPFLDLIPIFTSAIIPSMKAE